MVSKVLDSAFAEDELPVRKPCSDDNLFAYARPFGIISSMGEHKYPLLVKWVHDDLFPTVETQLQSPVLADAARAFRQNLLRIFCVSLTPAVVAAHALRPDGQEQRREDLDVGAHAVEVYTRAVQAVQNGITGIYYDAISSAWTTFEALATDVWIACVNARPNTMGAKAWVAKGWKDGPANDDSDVKRDTIGIDILQQYGFDLSNVLGTLIHRSRKFSFNRLRGIQHAYKVAFDAKAAELFAPKELIGFELLRNLIEHRGALVDQVFLDEVKGNNAIVPPEQVLGQPLRLDGNDVKNAVELAGKTSVGMLRFADRWLSEKPE